MIVTLTGDVSSRPSPASTFEYVEIGTGNHDVPTVTGVVPVAGPQTKPKPVTILGADFHTATSVKFGGVTRRPTSRQRQRDHGHAAAAV